MDLYIAIYKASSFMHSGVFCSSEALCEAFLAPARTSGHWAGVPERARHSHIPQVYRQKNKSRNPKNKSRHKKYKSRHPTTSPDTQNTNPDT